MNQIFCEEQYISCLMLTNAPYDHTIHNADQKFEFGRSETDITVTDATIGIREREE